MTNPYRDMCAELTTALEYVYDGRRPKVVQELIASARTLLDQPEPEELTDEELLRTYGLAKRDHCYEGDLDDWPKKAELAATVAGLRAAIAADRARRPTPHSPVDGEAVEVLQWPAEWSRKQRAQEAEMLCCSAGMTPGKEMQQLVQDARDGMPLQHLHDLISHAIPTPQPPADGEVAELVRYLKQEAEEMGYQFEHEPSRKFRRAAELLQRQHPQPVPVSERPWEREGWCDEQKRCWIFMPDIGTSPSWRLTNPRDISPCHTHSLPANALPTPASEVKL